MTRRRTLARLLRNRSGVAMIEFALGMPLLLTAGLWGAETANYALINMKIGQLAVHLADNASRVGDVSTLKDRKIYESDINDVLYGAQIQAGSMNLFANGRVIISSLEVDPDSGEQYIHWQRCRGAQHVPSSYGDEGETLPNGMGPANQEVLAQEGEAVIFVELHYNYQPLVWAKFVNDPAIFAISSFTVRDSRDLSQIYQRDPASPDPVQRCSSHDGTITLGSDGKIT